MENKKNQAARRQKQAKAVVVDEEKNNLKNIEIAIEKAKMMFDDVQRTEMDEEKWMRMCLFTLSLCSATLSRNHFGELIGLFWNTLRDCLEAKVLPALRETGSAESLLSEVHRSWTRYKELVRSLAKIFEPHDTAYQSSMGLSFKEAALEYFCHEVFEEMHDSFWQAISFLLWIERNGHEIAPNLVKNTFNFYIESGPKMAEWYEHLEDSLLQEIAQFYSGLSSDWIQNDSFHVYLNKVENVLNQERARMSKHLPPSALDILLEDVRRKMVDEKAERLVELFFGF